MLLAGAAIDRAWRAEPMRRVMAASIAITAVVFMAAGAASALAVFRLPDAFRSGAAAIGSACLIGGVTGMVLLRRRPVLAPVALAAATALGYGAAAVLLLPTFALEVYPYPWLGRLVAERASPSVALASIGAHTALVYYAGSSGYIFCDGFRGGAFPQLARSSSCRPLARRVRLGEADRSRRRGTGGSPPSEPTAVASAGRPVPARRHRAAARGKRRRGGGLLTRQLIL